MSRRPSWSTSAMRGWRSRSERSKKENSGRKCPWLSNKAIPPTEVAATICRPEAPGRKWSTVGDQRAAEGSGWIQEMSSSTPKQTLQRLRIVHRAFPSLMDADAVVSEQEVSTGAPQVDNRAEDVWTVLRSSSGNESALCFGSRRASAQGTKGILSGGFSLHRGREVHGHPHSGTKQVGLRVVSGSIAVELQLGVEANFFIYFGCFIVVVLLLMWILVRMSLLRRSLMVRALFTAG